MARGEERAVRKLEKQIAKAQQRLTNAESTKRRRGGLFGGIFLGTVAGGLLTYYLTRRDQDDEWEQEGADNAIVLREQPVPTGQTADIKPLPKLNVAPPEQDKGEVAATTLEETGESEQPAQQTQAAARPAPLTGAAPAQAAQQKQTEAPKIAEQPKSADAAPTEQPTQRVEQPTKAEAPEAANRPKQEAPKAAEQPQQDAPLSAEIERPEILLAKISGNTDEELAEATNHEPAPAPSEMPVEPVDGICPASHPIKGNRGNMGAMIYHVPGGRNYERTKPEACFATIEEAEAAGYRAPRG